MRCECGVRCIEVHSCNNGAGEDSEAVYEDGSVGPPVACDVWLARFTPPGDGDGGEAGGGDSEVVHWGQGECAWECTHTHRALAIYMHAHSMVHTCTCKCCAL